MDINCERADATKNGAVVHLSRYLIIFADYIISLTCLLPENMNESLASMVISTSCGKGVRLWMM